MLKIEKNNKDHEEYCKNIFVIGEYFVFFKRVPLIYDDFGLKIKIIARNINKIEEITWDTVDVRIKDKSWDVFVDNSQFFQDGEKKERN